MKCFEATFSKNNSDVKKLIASSSLKGAATKAQDLLENSQGMPDFKDAELTKIELTDQVVI